MRAALSEFATGEGFRLRVWNIVSVMPQDAMEPASSAYEVAVSYEPMSAVILKSIGIQLFGLLTRSAPGNLATRKAIVSVISKQNGSVIFQERIASADDFQESKDELTKELEELTVEQFRRRHQL